MVTLGNVTSKKHVVWCDKRKDFWLIGMGRTVFGRTANNYQLCPVFSTLCCDVPEGLKSVGVKA